MKADLLLIVEPIPIHAAQPYINDASTKRRLTLANNDVRRPDRRTPSSMESCPPRSVGVGPFCLEWYPQSSSSVMSGRIAGSSTALQFSVGALCGAKEV